MPIKSTNHPFKHCESLLTHHCLWSKTLQRSAQESPHDFSILLRAQESINTAIPFLADLALLEFAFWSVSTAPPINTSELKHIMLNPILEVHAVNWKGLHLFFSGSTGEASPHNTAEEYILVFRHPTDKNTRVTRAATHDLLALKIMSEDRDRQTLALENNVAIGVLDRAIERAVQKGYLLAPPSRIVRDKSFAKATPKELISSLSSEVFTLQWHLTQACDLHCKHCYDRSTRKAIEYKQAQQVLDQFRDFCLQKSVAGQISFTGGNPLLHPQFMELFQGAFERNLGIAILGNPTTEKILEKMLAISPLNFYQVSLEGLEDHNNQIRGPGHFERTIAFLRLLKSHDVYSMVMLTLTSDNCDQVLPLAEYLKDKCDLFTFNRLSAVGEGANLAGTRMKTYSKFLEKYLATKKTNPSLALKDSLFNILLEKKGQQLFGGCAGHGCGAAFNFVSLLPDGEVHACRKFPSYIGSINQESLCDIYDSSLAQKYRDGSLACTTCEIKAVCGGCLAVTQSSGLNCFVEKDPYCFKDEREEVCKETKVLRLKSR